MKNFVVHPSPNQTQEEERGPQDTCAANDETHTHPFPAQNRHQKHQRLCIAEDQNPSDKPTLFFLSRQGASGITAAQLGKSAAGLAKPSPLKTLEEGVPKAVALAQLEQVSFLSPAESRAVQCRRFDFSTPVSFSS